MTDPFLSAESELEVRARISRPKIVELEAQTEMGIIATTHGVTPFDWPPLQRQIQALVEARADPTLVGSVGYADNVWPLRLWGEDS